ncbi:hypothetical protein N7467_001205 [Penicillium canescens]|nr:hypothetical protein N7467_001205 [Penicillium canescens]
MSSISIHTKSTIRLPKASNIRTMSPVPVYDVINFSDARTEKLGELLAKGHDTVAPLRDPKLILHSHLPHFLGSAYALGADKDQLVRSYEHEITQLVPIGRGFIRGDAISGDNWRNFVAQKEYTVAYVDFFDGQVKGHEGAWTKVLEEYLYSGDEPLINGFTGGLGHPFIHLAYAYEFASPQVATQALSQGCTEYNPLHTLLDHPSVDNSTYKTTSLSEVIERVRKDSRFDSVLSEPGILNLDILTQRQHLDIVREHWNAWQVVDPIRQFEECCDLAVLIALSNGDMERSFDFYNAHILTVAHALRVLWTYLPPKHLATVLKQYVLFVILTYVSQLRPDFGIEVLEEVTLDGRGWDWVINTALNSKWALDVHFFKVVRAPKVFEETFGRKEDIYLKAAIKYVTEFRGWEGYGSGIEGFVPSRDGWMPE